MTLADLAFLALTAFLIVANGFFVAAEFALVKVRATQLEGPAAAGERLAGVALGLVHQLDSYLSATQLGITLTSLGLGWIGEPTIARILEPVFHSLHFSDEMGHTASFIIGFGLISFLHIVVGEVAPKSYAIARPVETSKAVSYPMRWFHFLFYPALIVLNSASNLLLRMVGVDEGNSHSLAVPADELARIAAESAAGGHISAGQGQMLNNVFTFSSRQASEIMVPRNRIHGLDLHDSFESVLSAALDCGHSRYPVYEGELESIVGVLHLMDLLKLPESERTEATLRELTRPPLMVPETLPAEKLMRRMQVHRTHLAVVIDEHGVVSGVVSLEDALEELVGEIQDEHDADEVDEIRQTPEGFEFHGVLNLDELATVLCIAIPESNVSTLQGLMMERLERLPVIGDQITIEDWALVVREMDGRTVGTVIATHTPTPDSETDAPTQH